jgi:hypothetical protein
LGTDVCRHEILSKTRSTPLDQAALIAAYLLKSAACPCGKYVIDNVIDIYTTALSRRLLLGVNVVNGTAVGDF